ncbi:hypothetical protein D918_04513 [Trichuris suis]|nr:hypothetical protein D918_04513 [Trichuris suis]
MCPRERIPYPPRKSQREAKMQSRQVNFLPNICPTDPYSPMEAPGIRAPLCSVAAVGHILANTGSGLLICSTCADVDEELQGNDAPIGPYLTSGSNSPSWHWMRFEPVPCCHGSCVRLVLCRWRSFRQYSSFNAIGLPRLPLGCARLNAMECSSGLPSLSLDDGEVYCGRFRMAKFYLHDPVTVCFDG